MRDKGIRGLVIKLGNMLNDVAVDGCTLTFGSGVSLAAASRKAAELGLSGMEFAVGIPGSIGGAVYMNAGAYDGEMAKVVTSVRVMELDGKISELPAAALDFAIATLRCRAVVKLLPQSLCVLLQVISSYCR